MAEQALAGLRVLDLSQHIAGPYCTKILAGFGADVLKIEEPGAGDPSRHRGPFLDDMPGPDRSGLFLYLNGGKKSITLNLRSSAGARIFRELVKDADVVVESFAPGMLERLGLDYESLEKVNPRLVMTSVSGFGQTGPYRDFKSADITAWAMSGARYSDGEPGRRPVRPGGWLVEHIAGVYGVAGTTTALYQRHRTGSGQHVDVSMLESMMLMPIFPAVQYSYLDEVHTGGGRERIGIFPCKDGHIGMMAYQLMHWQLMCAFFGMPELAEEPRFQTLRDVMDHIEETRDIIAPLVKDREKMELFHSGNQWRIPVALVPTTQEILESPQLQARGFLEEVDHPVMGKVTMPGAPFKMMKTPWQMKSPAPALGEHNIEIYAECLGYSREDLVRLREMGVI